MSRESLGTYARRLEAAMCRIRGGAVVLSPREWRLITEWHRREVPLSLILDTLEEVAAARSKRGRSRPPRSLGAVARAIEEAWQGWREGRVVAGTAAGSTRPATLDDRRESWDAVAESEREGPLGRLLRELLDALGRDADPAELDRRLDREIAGAVGERRARAAREAAERDLAPHASRMPPEAFASTLDRAVADRLRRELGLPRLGLGARRR